MTTIPQVSKAMQTVLTTVADTAARATGFVQRTSKLTGALFVQALTFGFWANPHATREQLAQTAAALGVQISPQGLDQRMTQSGADCLVNVLEAAVETVLCANPVAIPLLARFTGVFIQDSSSITLPRTLTHIWRGSGNHLAPSSQLKLSVRLDLLSGAITGPHLDHGITSDRSTTLQDAPIPAGSLRLSDLGYFTLDVLQSIGAAMGFWLTRFQITTALFTADGKPLDLHTFVQTQTTATVDLPIQLGSRQRLACRLLAARVPQEVADQRRRRLRQEAKRRGGQPNAVQLAVADWTLMVTNVAAEMLSVAEALVVARSRWQIECLWKLWKSQGQIDTWRSGRDGAILCEAYAKLLAMVLQHWMMLVSCWAYPDRSLTKAAASIRLHVMALAVALRDEERLGAVLEVIVLCLRVGCRINKRKTAPHTYQHLLDAPGLFLA